MDSGVEYLQLRRSDRGSAADCLYITIFEDRRVLAIGPPALVDHGDVLVAQRFEAFVNGMELANGYHELTDAKEQKRRFIADLKKCSDLNKSPNPISGQRPVDQRLLAAMESGLPPSAGVALGLDRLLMLMVGESHLSDVISFDFLNA